MKTFDTTFITLKDGTSIWLSPEASASDAAQALLADAASHETRKVIRAASGLILKLGDTILGSQAWLQDGMSADGITEALPEDDNDDLGDDTQDDSDDIQVIEIDDTI